MINLKLFLKRAINRSTYREFQRFGYDYIINPNTGELHHLNLDSFRGSHNLAYANLNKFIGITNIGVFPIHCFRDGKIFPLYQDDNGKFIGNCLLNKCKHCFG
jgi:hypothetical protein